MRKPYVPDVKLRILDIHGSKIKPAYRVLTLAFGAYLKLNIRVNAGDSVSIEKLTENDRERWYDKVNIDNTILKQLFFESTDSAGKKFMLLATNNTAKLIIEHLRHDVNINNNNSWFVESLHYLIK